MSDDFGVVPVLDNNPLVLATTAMRLWRKPGLSQRVIAMDQRFALAIQKRRVLRVLYDGHWRDFEPYLYGQLSSGREVLFGWQASGAYVGWRTLYLYRRGCFSITDQTFVARLPEYERERPPGLITVYADAIEPSA